MVMPRTCWVYTSYCAAERDNLLFLTDVNEGEKEDLHMRGQLKSDLQ